MTKAVSLEDVCIGLFCGRFITKAVLLEDVYRMVGCRVSPATLKCNE